MLYYAFHLGDYAQDTAHLSPMEDLAYRRMLDLYYRTEAPLTSDLTALCRLIRMTGMAAEVEAVLREFFTPCDAGWRHARCDAELSRYQAKQQQAASAGKASAQRRFSGRSTDVQRTFNQPITNNQEPIEEKEAKASSSPGATKRPAVPCPYDAIVAAYHEALPMLPKVKVMDDKRKAALRKRWGWVLSTAKPDGTPRAANGDEALAWFAAFFDRAAANDWLTGRAPRSRGHEGWKCTLDFLLRDEGLKAVVERTEVAA